MKQISPNPSLTKRGTFFGLTYILAKEDSAPPFVKGRLGGISAFLAMLVKCPQTIKVAALVRQFDDYRIVSPLVRQLTQGWKNSDCALALLLCPTRIRLSTTYPLCLSTMHKLAGFFCLKFVISHP